MKYLYSLFLCGLLITGVTSAQEISEENTLDTNTSAENLTQEFVPIESSIADVYYQARVTKVEKIETELLGQPQISQTLTMEILNQDKKGETVIIVNGGGVDLQESQLYTEGDVLIIVETKVGEEIKYYIQDRYRLPGLAIMVASFVILSIIFGGKRGIGALIGLIVSVGVLVWYLMPALLAGQNPVFATFIASIGIMSLTLFISHGFRLRTMISFVSMLITFGISYGLSVIFVYVAQMFGVGSEDTFYLAYITDANIDLRGILLAGIMIGMLGVLDDVTMGQASSIDEIKRANPTARFKELYKAGMSVGKDHIASLVNTLALAYVGASLPLFLLLYVNSSKVPIWVTINSEFIAQELIRSITGSMAIVLAVPITSIIAAKVFEKYIHKDTDRGHSHHHHHH
jgi:uncharacterized membrane protein